jgi:hypothetical protein
MTAAPSIGGIMTAKEHNRLAGIFLMAHGGFQAVVMVFMCIFYAIVGSALFIGNAQDGGAVVGLAFIAVVAFIAIISVVFILPQILGGYLLLKEKPNARTWGIIGSILSCLSFPIGTAAGVYGLWFLFGEQGKQFYLGPNAQRSFPTPPQPPAPNSWQ